MSREIGRWRALLVAGFAVAVLAIGGFGLYQVASRRWHVQPVFHVRAKFPTISGLEAGHRVRLQGIEAGVVEQVVPPASPGDPVELVLRLDNRLHSLVRTDAVARILAEGMVGARVVEISPGGKDSPVVAEGGVIGSEPPLELTDLMKRTSVSLAQIEQMAATARTGLEEINAIAKTIRQGEGSLGKFVQDEAAYQNLVALTRRGEQTISTLEDNLTALKQTWPLSRYFDSRTYSEREKILYQPGSRKESLSIAADDLFEPGRAILTPDGRKRLDDAVKWFKEPTRTNSEFVIAAFSDDHRDQDLAEVLTQEQADAVRNYLINKHGINSAGWFRTRKVAAVGFGSQRPRIQDPSPDPQPPRRVEIILFTPQT